MIAKKLRRIGPWCKVRGYSLCAWESTPVEFPTNTAEPRRIKREKVEEEFLKHSCAEHPKPGRRPIADDQLDVGRQHNNRFRIPVQESCVGAEYWVGDNSTRSGGQGKSKLESP